MMTDQDHEVDDGNDINQTASSSSMFRLSRYKSSNGMSSQSFSLTRRTTTTTTTKSSSRRNGSSSSSSKNNDSKSKHRSDSSASSSANATTTSSTHMTTTTTVSSSRKRTRKEVMESIRLIETQLSKTRRKRRTSSEQQQKQQQETELSSNSIDDTMSDDGSSTSQDENVNDNKDAYNRSNNDDDDTISKNRHGETKSERKSLDDTNEFSSSSKSSVIQQQQHQNPSVRSKTKTTKNGQKPSTAEIIDLLNDENSDDTDDDTETDDWLSSKSFLLSSSSESSRATPVHKPATSASRTNPRKSRSRSTAPKAVDNEKQVLADTTLTNNVSNASVDMEHVVDPTTVGINQRHAASQKNNNSHNGIDEGKESSMSLEHEVDLIYIQSDTTTATVKSITKSVESQVGRKLGKGERRIVKERILALVTESVVPHSTKSTNHHRNNSGDGVDRRSNPITNNEEEDVGNDRSNLKDMTKKSNDTHSLSLSNTNDTSKTTAPRAAATDPTTTAFNTRVTHKNDRNNAEIMTPIDTEDSPTQPLVDHRPPTQHGGTSTTRPERDSKNQLRDSSSKGTNDSNSQICEGHDQSLMRKDVTSDSSTSKSIPKSAIDSAPNVSRSSNKSNRTSSHYGENLPPSNSVIDTTVDKEKSRTVTNETASSTELCLDDGNTRIRTKDKKALGEKDCISASKNQEATNSKVKSNELDDTTKSKSKATAKRKTKRKTAATESQYKKKTTEKTPDSVTEPTNEAAGKENQKNAPATKTAAPARPRKRTRAKACALCKTCPCQKASFDHDGTTSSTLDMSSTFSRSDAAVEKALIRRFQKLERSAEHLADQKELVRRNLKKHRKDVWKRQEREASTNSHTSVIPIGSAGQQNGIGNDDWFLPDAQIFEQQDMRATKTNASLVEKAQLSTFTNIALRQPSLMDMGFSVEKLLDADEPKDLANEGYENDVSENPPEKHGAEEPCHESSFNNTFLGPNRSDTDEMFDDDPIDEEYVGEGGQSNDFVSRRSWNSTRCDDDANDTESLYEATWIQDAMDRPILQHAPQDDKGQAQPSFYTSFDKLFEDPESMFDTKFDIDDDDINAFEEETSPIRHCASQNLPVTSDDSKMARVDLSMLSQEAQYAVQNIWSNISNDQEKVARLEQAAPDWKENIAFSFHQKEPLAIDEALKNLRQKRERMKIIKKRLLDAWERHDAALDVFEETLDCCAERAKRRHTQTKQNDGSMNIHACDYEYNLK